MRSLGWWRLLALDCRRSWGRLFSAGIGVALAIAILAFLLGLGRGVRSAVDGGLAPDDRLEVAAATTQFNLGPLRLGMGRDTLDSEDIETLGSLPGVVAVWPKVGLSVPVVASGGERFLGQRMVTELPVEGIAPEVVADDLGDDRTFAARPAPGADAPRCRFDSDCPEGRFCVDTTDGSRVCRAPIPVVLSKRVVDLYDRTLRKAYGLPRINPGAAVGLGADVRIGASTFGLGGGSVGVLHDRMKLVGFSDRVSPLSATIPLDEVVRLNRYFGDRDRRGGFDSVTLKLDSPRRLGEVGQAVRRRGFRMLSAASEKIGAAIATAFTMMMIVGIAVVAVAALGVSHTFALLLSGRRNEIGVLRAVGASRLDVAGLFLVESMVTGAAAGLVGAGLGWAAGRGAEIVLSRVLEGMPGVPELLFEFDVVLAIGLVVLSAVFSGFGALVPILRSVRSQPLDMV